MPIENEEGTTPEPTVLDAINEALEEVGGTKHEQTEDTDTGDAGTESTDDLLEEGGDEDATGDAEGVDPEGESGEAAVGENKPAGKAGATEQPAKYADLVSEATKLGVPKQHADGRFKSGAELAAEIAAKKGDGKAGEAAVGKKPADPLTDAIPKDLKPETQQRIRTLIDRTKSAEAQATEAKQNFDYMVGGLQAVGATPEQYGETLSFLALFNSNDPAQQKQALDILEDMAEKTATLLGVERKSSDPLAAHADLKLAIQNRQITPELAKEMARQRNQGSFRQELTTAANTTQQQQQQYTRAVETARSELNTLEADLKRKDRDFARKSQQIVPILKPLFMKLHPSQWKSAFEEAYAQARVAPLVRAKVPTNQPMRGGKAPAGSGGAGTAGGSGLSGGGPSTMLEAVNAALSGR